MIDYAGVKFKNPLVIASSPLTSKLKWLMEADKQGVAAVSTKLTFIRQPFYGKLRMYTNPKIASLVCYDRRLDIQEGLRLVDGAKKKTNLVIFANITHDCNDLDGWALLGKEHEKAGADIIEANLICPNIGLSTKNIHGEGFLKKGDYGGAVAGQIPGKAASVIKALKESVKIPVVAKLTPNVTDISIIAKACESAGADGVCLAGGQSSLPPVDIYNEGKPCYPLLEGVSHGSLCGPACLNMAFSQVAQVAKKTALPIIGGGGLQTAEECIMMMMWGASLVTMCTSIMWYGWNIAGNVVRGIETYIERINANYQDIIGKSLQYLRYSIDLKASKGWATVDSEKCNGCGKCKQPGHCDAVSIKNKKSVIESEKCLGCGICAALCPTGAITLKVQD